ncbi:hypothetical protein GLO73106DRAFT_00037490 [Gloeocapsa sp. PCC 73106]|nr:hypothetical protein GLO73106DRAFT_00037490 [Gloeocapsa sp. PCC 73106]
MGKVNSTRRQHKHLTIPEVIQTQIIDSLLQSNQLSFCTFYCEKAMLKTIIYSDGEITQQVSQNLIIDPELLTSLFRAHYWTISELLLVQKLPKKTRINFWLILVLLVSLLIVIYLFIS